MASAGWIVLYVFTGALLVTAFVLSILAYLEATKTEATSTASAFPPFAEVTASGSVTFAVLEEGVPSEQLVLFNPTLSQTATVKLSSSSSTVTGAASDITALGFKLTASFSSLIQSHLLVPETVASPSQTLFPMSQVGHWLLFAKNGKNVSAFRSEDNGATWSDAVTVAPLDLTEFYFITPVMHTNNAGEPRIKVFISTTGFLALWVVEAVDENATSWMPVIELRATAQGVGGGHSVSALPTGDLLVTFQSDTPFMWLSMKVRPDNTTTADANIADADVTPRSTILFSHVTKGSSHVTLFRLGFDGAADTFFTTDGSVDTPTWTPGVQLLNLPVVSYLLCAELIASWGLDQFTDVPFLIRVSTNNTFTITKFTDEGKVMSSEDVTINQTGIAGPTTPRLQYLSNNRRLLVSGVLDDGGVLETLYQVSNGVGNFNPDEFRSVGKTSVGMNAFVHATVASTNTHSLIAWSFVKNDLTQELVNGQYQSTTITENDVVFDHDATAFITVV